MYMLFILMKKERRQTEDLRSVTEPPGYPAPGGSETLRDA